jgi:WD40 repeat protein
MTFLFTASQNGTLRIWSSDFSKLISEVSINQEVASCDISQDQNQIAILSKDGTLSLLELEASSFRVLMRSHQDEIVDLVINNMSGCLVSIGKDSSIKVWLAETMEQVHEFNTSEHDPPTAVASSSKNAFVAVGFKSGFLRVFDMTERKMIHETMVFESCIMDISFAKNGKFMAVFFKNGRIVIMNVEFDFTPVKNIDYEFPNGNYFSVDFSPDGCLLANISSNANTITVWETKNFSLRHYCDFTGEIISKLAFAPNGRDLLVITTNSKLKILRLPDEGVQSTEL